MARTEAPQPLRVSARTGEGLEALLERIVALLPESPPLYPEDELSDRPMRFLAAELVREAAFEELEQELPYALAVEVRRVRRETARISCASGPTCWSNARSQKQIVIGRGGEVIKRIGIARPPRDREARRRRRVHLELWVKLEPKWSRRPNRLKSLGYT